MAIYIVDDNPDICDFLTFLLCHEGYRVHSFADPEAALTHMQLKQVHPDILITDYNMPKLNGYQLHQRVCQQAPGVKTIVISGRNVSHLIGKLHFLQKPFPPDHMVKLVSALHGTNNAPD